MIRSELVLRLAAQNPHLYEKDCEAVVKAILGRIEDALAAGDRVEIRGFGAFSAKDLRARQAATRGRARASPWEKKAVQFKPGKEIRQRINPKAEDIGRDVVRLLLTS